VAWGLEIFMLLIWLCLPSKLGDYWIILIHYVLLFFVWGITRM
jgi:hypothetical protein